MIDTVIRYTLIDKNQAKIANAATMLISHIDSWLKAKPSGKLEMSIELNANQGGLGDIYIERKERGKI